MTLASAFWIAACGNLVLPLILLFRIVAGPNSRYDGLLAVLLLGFIVVVCVVMGVVALIRKPAAYVVGLVLAIVPLVSIAGQYVSGLVAQVTAPSEAALQAGHGYFTGDTNRALADAIVARDGAKVAAILPTANPNAFGWNRMTMLRLALEDGHAVPDIVAALLRAGADPDQSQQILFGGLTLSGADTGAMISNKNEPLLRAVLDTGVDLNSRDPVGYPRFFSGLKWPEGLALMLAKGANIEAEDKSGNTRSEERRVGKECRL